jgi:hypothetical protein
MLKTLKSWAKRYSDTEAAVHDATSTDPWGPSGTEMDKIAQLTYNQEDFVEIRDMLVTRLNNNEGKNWRQVYKVRFPRTTCVEFWLIAVIWLESRRDQLHPASRPRVREYLLQIQVLLDQCAGEVSVL